jgi:hypothetical protein
MAMDTFTVVTQMDNYHFAIDFNDYQINQRYAFSNAITLESENR